MDILTNLVLSGLDDKLELGVDTGFLSCLGCGLLLVHTNSTYRGYKSSYPLTPVIQALI